MDIISKKLANDMIYAYHNGRFWRWDDTQSVWKESHLMAQKFGRAKAASATLTPEVFLTDGAQFIPLDDYEIDIAMMDALKDAKPCKTAPIEPVEEKKSASEPYIQHCDYSKSHKCENMAGLRHFIKHGEIHGCAGCCPICKKCGTCEYRCAYVNPVKEGPECVTAQNAGAAVTTESPAVKIAAVETSTTSENVADANNLSPALSPYYSSLAPSENVASTSATLSALPTTANADGVIQGALPTTEQDKPLLFLREDKCPEFDYSGLSEQTVADLHLAENEYIHGKKLAERGLIHMGDAIAIAHDALVAQCDKHNNQHSEDTFRSWCCSIGITKDSAYRLLQVSALMEGSSPRQKEILEALPPTLLYAVAKPSAPQELVEKVKNGEIASNKEYQALLKENQQLRTDRVNAMNQADREKARADSAFAEIGDKEKTIKSLLDRSEEADSRADEAESRYKAALADVTGLQEQYSQMSQRANDAEEARIAARLQCQKAECERDKAEQRAKEAEAALKKQPITAVVDEEEVDKRAHQQAYAIAADMTSELREQLEAAQAAPPVDPQEDIETATSCIVNITGIWSMATPTFTRLVGIGEEFDQLADALLQTCDRIKKEVMPP